MFEGSVGGVGPIDGRDVEREDNELLEDPAEILGDPYVKMVPLPRIPNYRDLGRRPNPLSVRNSNIAERTQVRKNLNLLNGQAELMTSQ